MQGGEERYYRDPESRRWYQNKKHQQNSEQEKEYIKKRNIGKNPEQKRE